MQASTKALAACSSVVSSAGESGAESGAEKAADYRKLGAEAVSPCSLRRLLKDFLDSHAELSSVVRRVGS